MPKEQAGGKNRGEKTCLALNPRGPSDTHNTGKLPVLPASHSQQKPKHIPLLLPPKLFNVLISTCKRRTTNDQQENQKANANINMGTKP
jgi:hypothetical protein